MITKPISSSSFTHIGTIFPSLFCSSLWPSDEFQPIECDTVHAISTHNTPSSFSFLRGWNRHNPQVVFEKHVLKRPEWDDEGVSICESPIRGKPGTPLQKAMTPHSSTLAWKIPWTEEPGRLQSVGLLRVGHDWATSLSRIGEGNGNPLQCSCLENTRDGGAWWAAIYGVAQSRTLLKRLSGSSSSSRNTILNPYVTKNSLLY